MLLHYCAAEQGG